MIIATAGHIDHGKTSLVKALTGVDADRLPEEKRRGMTIDLGYAYFPVDGAEPLGFIDVPGHERLIHNMLCGVTGIDFALLVVAADDGIMPQTREHLAILDILGIDRGAVALTKIDRADGARVDSVEAEIRALLAGTTLAAAPLFRVASITGDGIPALRSHLSTAAGALRQREAVGHFRLAVDRAFSVVGAGLVATGTVFAGSVRVGDEVRLLGAGVRARVRGIHAQNRATDGGRAGQRCALNIAGPDLAKDRVVRGDWIVAGGVPPPTRRIDVRLRIAEAGHAFAHWTPVHAHLGAAETTGRVALLDAKSIEPGGSGLAQLYLDHPIGAVFGDKFVIRDQSARLTLGGGRVIDMFPPARGRAKPERIRALAAMAETDAAKALAGLLAASPAGVDFAKFAANRNLTTDEMAKAAAAVPMRRVPRPSGDLGFSPETWTALTQIARDALAAWHKAEPESPGLSETRLFAGGAVRLAPEASAAVAAELVSAGAALRSGVMVRLATHTRTMTATDEALWRRVLPLLQSNRLAPPALTDMASALKIEPIELERLLVRVGRHGLVARISKGRFLLPETLRGLAQVAETVAAKSPGGLFGAAAFRDAAGIGRNLAIDVLEYFDRVKFTQRRGEARKVFAQAEKVLGGAQAGLPPAPGTRPQATRPEG